ncbi:MAG: aminopeptidase [Anaerolineales bacterium]|nr:MAG: aminopeptidase [Anaerolineales bacterium]
MIDDFERKLEKYAEVAVRVGNNLQPGQRLLIIGKWLNRGVPPELTKFIQKVTVAAYQAGAPLVDVIWADQQTDLLRFQYAPNDSFDEYPLWFVSALLEYLERGDALMVLFAEDPQLLKDQDPDIVAQATRAAYANFQPALKYVTNNIVNWVGISAPIAGWADMVLPDIPEAERLDRMWEAIFKICRVDQDDPIAAWEAHLEDLRKRCTYLNDKHFNGLRYQGPGTDITIGLAREHIWQSGGMKTTTGISFTANIPTEEVFCLPDKDRVEGVVSASMPLSYAGTLIEDFQLTFKDGSVVGMEARQGKAALQSLLDMDEGARRLGEVALVPHSSQISQLGWLFYNTLYDENAACHIALGRGIRSCLEAGPQMADEEFLAAGGNHSKIHVDFMIGSNALDIDGLREDGSLEPVMRHGEWAF